VEEAFGTGEQPLDRRMDHGEPVQQAPPAEAPEPVARVVARDRSNGTDRDHGLDRIVTVGGKDCGGDQRRLPWEGHACTLHSDQREDEEEAVMEDVLGQGG